MVNLLRSKIPQKPRKPSEPIVELAEGARFELAVHEVDAGFQDRWFQPLTHPSIVISASFASPLILCINLCINLRVGSGAKSPGMSRVAAECRANLSIFLLYLFAIML